jgi:F0F1-type ATP synthase assembly protein I
MRKDDGNDRDAPPWWSEDASEDAPLPEGYPERPDLERVRELREKLAQDKAARRDPHRTRLHDRIAGGDGQAVRQIGSLTLIPMMMVVGPVIGYLVGRWVEGRFGGSPWVGVGGALFGLAAAVRQIVIMLSQKNGPSKE